MKTILVLTDFSKSARNAADTAIQIAEKLNVDILLFNSYLDQPLIPSAVVAGSPAEEMELFQNKSKKGLEIEAHRLEKLLAGQHDVLRKPGLQCMNAEGSLSANVQTVLKEKEIGMIVMGGRCKTNIGCFLGSDIYTVINKATCPVLVVPENRVGLHIKNLVFATDLAKEDIKAIKYLTKLSEALKFNIHLSHVSEDVLVMDLMEEEDISGFTDAVSKLNMKNLSFNNLKGNNIVKELEKFTKSVHADIMAMVHKKHTLFWKLFNDSHSRTLIKNQKTPILVLPEQWGD